MSRTLLALLLLGCGGPPETTVPEPAPAAAPDPAPAPGRWTPASISQLQPAPPATKATTRHPVTVDPGIAKTMRRLGQVVDDRARDPDDPWALGHGILVRGADMKLADGSSAVDHLFAKYALSFEAQGNQLVWFPEQTGNTLIQPHAELLLKALTEAGVSPARRVLVEGQSHPVADLYRGSVVRTYLVPEANHSSFASTNDMPWALQALAAWAPADLQWQALDGTPMSLDTLTDFNAVVLKKETRFLARAMAQRSPFKKQRQGIYQYTCGGAHLIQGVGFAVARGFGHKRGVELVKEQGPLALFRMQVELEQLDAAAKAQPTVAFQVHIQRLKLTGHTLETLHKMSAAGQLQQDERTTKAMQWVASEVVRSVALLEGHKAFDRLDKIKAKDLQLYRDIVGDSCHALRGLLLATGEGHVRL
jgi:hypothetical protein